MKKTILTLMVACLGCTAMAAPVGADRAAAVARVFWQVQMHGKSDATLVQQSWQYDNVYLFTADCGGWLLVAADDCARPVLAWSLDGSVNPQQMPAAMENTVYVYHEEIGAVRLEADYASRTPHEEWSLLESGNPLKDGTDDEVQPLMSTQWYQRSPYNMYCPSYTMTGCVATAMAQVMKYWNFPAFGHGSHSYSDDTGYGLLSADFGDTRYDWDHMPNRLTSSSSTAEKEAVATLMYHCGVSVNMHYSTIYSGTTINKCEVALPTYFHYNSADIHYRAKGQISNDAWTDTLIAEVRQLRPVLHGGSGPAGGHCFVCDGFNAQRYLHFNLGEDGDGDGYYAVGAITYGAYSFNQSNDAILGVHPGYGLLLSADQLGYTRQGGRQQVWLSTCDTLDIPWTATAGADWITLSDTDFDRLGQVSIDVEENNTGAERTATVTFTQGSHTAILTVVQEAYDPASDYCPLTVLMENTHNEPWAGDAHLSFESLSGTVYGTAQHTANSGSSSTTVSVAPHDVMVRWHPGGARDRYINYKVQNQYGETLVEVDNAYFDGADVLLPWPCARVGIDDVDASAYSIWPNPATVRVSVASSDGRLFTLALLDVAGRVLLQSNGSSLDLGAVAQGVYYLRIVSDGNVQVRKLIKQ